MVIRDDVRAVAEHWAGKKQTAFTRLLQSIDYAEGNIIRAVDCSQPDVHTRQQALEDTARTIVHHMAEDDFLYDPETLVNRLGRVWAPIGAANDPKGLNKNWVGNVLKFWLGA